MSDRITEADRLNGTPESISLKVWDELSGPRHSTVANQAISRKIANLAIDRERHFQQDQTEQVRIDAEKMHTLLRSLKDNHDLQYVGGIIADADIFLDGTGLTIFLRPDGTIMEGPKGYFRRGPW